MAQLNASFQNNRNNGYAPNKQASSLFEVGEFLVFNGLGQVMSYDGTDLITYSGASGAFTLGETVTGGTSGATAVVVSDVSASNYMTLSTVVGTFAVGETITGGISGDTATVVKFVVRNKIVGLCNEQITAGSSNYAQAVQIGVSTAVNVLDFIDIPVITGTAVASMVGSYFNVDTTDAGGISVSVPGVQILITKVIDADNVVGAIALNVA